jgi:hypothetical protein
MIYLLVLMACHDRRTAMPVRKAKRSASANPPGYPSLWRASSGTARCDTPRRWQSRCSTFAKARQGLTSG